ncbi:MAG: hypothetical protein ACE5EU_06070 [Paracoccaceae bacterium]
MKPIHAMLAAAATLLATAGPVRADTIYECTGIGLEAREAAESVPHTLRLEFAQADGHYLGGVAARLSDAGGNELLSVRCPGPWLLLDLPDGTYRVSASFEGKTVTGRATIRGGKWQRLVLVF